MCIDALPVGVGGGDGVCACTKFGRIGVDSAISGHGDTIGGVDGVTQLIAIIVMKQRAGGYDVFVFVVGKVNLAGSLVCQSGGFIDRECEGLCGGEPLGVGGGDVKT